MVKKAPYKLEFLPQALQDMADAASYIAHELYDPDAAQRLLDDISDAVRRAGRFPYAYPLHTLCIPRLSRLSTSTGKSLFGTTLSSTGSMRKRNVSSSSGFFTRGGIMKRCFDYEPFPPFARGQACGRIYEALRGAREFGEREG